MSTDVKFAKRAIHDKFEAQIDTANAKLSTLKARAEGAKATVELKAIAELVTKKQAILQKLHYLKKSDGGQWEHLKTDLEAMITDLENSVRQIELKANAN